MNKSHIIWIFVVVAMICLALNVHIRFINAILTENGTCTNGNVTVGVNHSIDFFKNLTNDNTQLAELMCQNMLNETILR